MFETCFLPETKEFDADALRLLNHRVEKEAKVDPLYDEIYEEWKDIRKQTIDVTSSEHESDQEQPIEETTIEDELQQVLKQCKIENEQTPVDNDSDNSEDLEDWLDSVI